MNQARFTVTVCLFWNMNVQGCIKQYSTMSNGRIKWCCSNCRLVLTEPKSHLAGPKTQYLKIYTIVRLSPDSNTVYPKKHAHGFCFAVLCCGYKLTDLAISIRLTILALWQSNDRPSASKATPMNMDKYFMWIHYERLHNHNKAKHNKTVCIFLGIYCILPMAAPLWIVHDYNGVENYTVVWQKDLLRSVLVDGYLLLLMRRTIGRASWYL